MQKDVAPADEALGFGFAGALRRFYRLAGESAIELRTLAATGAIGHTLPVTEVDQAARHTRHCYRHSGVLVGSDIEFPEWSTFACPEPGMAPDIVIGRGAVRTDYDPSCEHAEYRAGCLKFAVPQAGRWAVEGGRRITVDIEPSREAEARLFTLGSAWGALGYQRGWAMLHGSAVRVDGKTALFAGEAGQGKSTMAAALIARGAELIADDLSRCGTGQGERARLYPSAGRIKLWDTAIDHLGWQDRQRTRDHFRDDKFHLETAPQTIDCEPVLLSTVFVLEWGDEIAIERLRGGEAVTALSEATIYRKGYLELMGGLATHVVACARVAASTAVYRLARPSNLAMLDDVCDRVGTVLE